jgi:diguanylate cyclase (GGDEF)-like protein
MILPTIRRQFSRASSRLVIIGAVLVSVIAGTAGWLILEQRDADLAEGQRATANLAQVLAEQTSRSLQPIDLSLREIQSRLTNSGILNHDNVLGWGSKATFDMLVEWVKGLPLADALMVIGADGRVVNFSRAFPPVPLNASTRDYYLYLSTHDGHALFVSAPAKSYLQGAWTVFLARRVNDPQGAFAGIVVAAVTLSYLEDFYRAVTRENEAVTVLRRDGLILARSPPTEDQIGKKLPAEAPWYGLLEKGGGSYRSPGYVGTETRLVSVRPLREFPLVIDVSMTQAEALSQWPQQVMWLMAGAVLAAACVIFLLRVFGKQYGRLAQQNAQLEISRVQFDAVLDNMSQGLTLFDSDRNLVVCNHRFAEMYGLSPQQTRPGTSFADIIKYRVARGTSVVMTPADYLARAKNLVDTGTFFELTNELSDGRIISLHSQPLASGGWVSTHEDITERRHAEATLAFTARHDALTKLANRMLFQERLVAAIAKTRDGTHCALLCLDLDCFKVINDTLGHPVGDGLLCAVADRLSAVVRDGDTVARLGGDEFAIIQADLTSPGDAEVLADRIIAALGQPYEVDGHRIVAGVSMGISTGPTDGTSSDTLLCNADIALYLAKTEGGGAYRFFAPEMQAPIQARRAVDLDLRSALSAEAFELYYQPILDLQSGRVTGFEALIRWHHPVRGLISPADFIPVAEETGLIIPIGEWVLRQACQEAVNWPRDIEIAVNLSPVQFKSARLLEGVREALAVSGLDPRRLELEITETVLLQNSEATLTLLHQLRALGIHIALDDFGTGYSSLSYLRSFPFDKIKIDRSFIRDVDTNKDSAVIVGAIVDLARGLGMTTVAEGVETQRQLATSRRQRCTKVQGYLFSRPVPAREVPALIRTLCISEPRQAEWGEAAGDHLMEETVYGDGNHS